jgi:hypothetical protein
MKTISVLILSLCFINCLCAKIETNLDTAKIDDTLICFCRSFNKDSLVFYVNDTLIYSGYIGDKTKGYGKFYYFVKHQPLSEVSFRVILYKNQNDFKELIEQKEYPTRYNDKPNMDMQMILNKNPSPRNIYFEGGHTRLDLKQQSAR